MKTKDELIKIKEEYEKLSRNLGELNAEELKQVVSGKLPAIHDIVTDDEAMCHFMTDQQYPTCPFVVHHFPECATCPKNPENNK